MTQPMRLVAVMRATMIDDAVETGACVASGGVALVLAPVDGDDRAAARRGHRQVVGYWRAGAVLPGGMRSVFRGGRSEARDWLRASLPMLREGLDAVAGRAEYVISAEWAAEATPPAAATEPSSGRDYLRHRARILQASEARQAQLIRFADALAARLGASEPVIVPSPVGADISVLAPREGRAAINAALTDLQLDGARVAASGPWPPYSFAARLLSPSAPDDESARRKKADAA